MLHTLLYLTATDTTLEDIDLTMLQKMWEAFWPKALHFLKLLAIALVVLFIGKKLIKLVLKIMGRSFERAKAEAGVVSFVTSLVKFVLYGILIVIILGILGLETSSFIALIGSAGLTLGLALQGSLSNFAGGVLILLLKPFVVGDYIITNGQEGTVTSIDIFYTKLTTIDNRLIVMPNGEMSNRDIINVTVQPKRRLDLVIPVGYDTNLGQAKAILERIITSQEVVIKEEPINVFVDSFGDSAINLGVRAWVSKEEFWPLKWDTLEKIKAAFDENGISIPFNQLDVTIKQQ